MRVSCFPYLRCVVVMFCSAVMILGCQEEHSTVAVGDAEAQLGQFKNPIQLPYCKRARSVFLRTFSAEVNESKHRFIAVQTKAGARLSLYDTTPFSRSDPRYNGDHELQLDIADNDVVPLGDQFYRFELKPHGVNLTNVTRLMPKPYMILDSARVLRFNARLETLSWELIPVDGRGSRDVFDAITLDVAAGKDPVTVLARASPVYSLPIKERTRKQEEFELKEGNRFVTRGRSFVVNKLVFPHKLRVGNVQGWVEISPIKD